MSDGADFSNHPKSITELRSARSGNGADWTPRDALIDALRAIDSGEINPDALVVCMRAKDAPGGTMVEFRNAGPDPLTSIGLLMTVAWRLQQPA